MNRKTLALFGSGEFTPAMSETDRYLTGNVKAPKVAIVPTAAGQEHDWWKWVDNGIRHFASLGVPAFGIPVRNAQDANTPEKISALGQATLIYISGGDPGYLLSSLEKSLLWERVVGLYESGIPLVGSSAGAMILGGHLVSNIYAVFDQGAPDVAWTRAFGLVPHTIWPHFDYIQSKEHARFTALMENAPADVRRDWLGIDEDTAVIWEGSPKPSVLGKGKAHWSA